MFLSGWLQILVELEGANYEAEHGWQCKKKNLSLIETFVPAA